MKEAIPSLAANGALWIVYPKGRKEITELQVLNSGRDAGLVDIKVVGYSATHTALKFVRPKNHKRSSLLLTTAPGRETNAHRARRHDGRSIVPVWGPELGLLGANVDFAQAGSLTTQRAQVIQLGTAHAGRTNDLNLFDHLRVQREDALDTLAKAHLADDEAGLRSLALCDDQPFEHLHAFFVAFLDLYVDPHGVARFEFGKSVRRVLAINRSIIGEFDISFSFFVARLTAA